jgi:hypothetical protein
MLARLLNNLDAGQPLESLRALDWLNFFLAALLVGFGPFVAVHLAENGWAPASIGAILTISGLAGLMTQVPAGELIDVIASKRALFGAAAATLALALTIFGLRSDFPVGISVLHPSEAWPRPRSWVPLGICYPRETYFWSPPRWRSHSYWHFCGYAAPIFTSADPVALPIIMR